MKLLKRILAAAALVLGLSAPALASTVLPTLYQVFPTRNDIASTQYEGRNFQESTLTRFMANFGSQNFVANGLTGPASSANLNYVVSAGRAYINGYFTYVSQNTTVAFAASNVNYVWLELPTTSGYVSTVRFNVNTSAVAPSTNALLLISGTATGTSISAAADARVLTSIQRLTGQFQNLTVAGTAGWTVPAGVTYVVAEMQAAGGGGGGCSGGGGGGGGGSGAYRVEGFSVTPGTVVSYRVGLGGAGGTNAPTTGTAGTDTWFSTSSNNAAGGSGGVGCSACSGNGGSGGVSPTASSTVYGIAGNFGSYGALASTVYQTAVGRYGEGGYSVFGKGGANAGSPATAGSPSPNRGGGGGGATGGSNAGAAGGDGLLILHF